MMLSFQNSRSDFTRFQCVLLSLWTMVRSFQLANVSCIFMISSYRVKNLVILNLSPFLEQTDKANDPYFYFYFLEYKYLLCLKKIRKKITSLSVTSFMNPSLTGPSNNAFISIYGLLKHSLLSHDSQIIIDIVLGLCTYVLLYCISQGSLEKQNEQYKW